MDTWDTVRMVLESRRLGGLSECQIRRWNITVMAVGMTNDCSLRRLSDKRIL